MEGEDQFLRDAGVLQGSREGMGSLQVRQGAWALREPPGKQEPWPQRLLFPPRSPNTGPGPARPGPGSPKVNALRRHQGQEAATFFTEKGVRALGAEVEAVTLPSWVL